ncbi:MAG TPA: ABC transporter permease subunit [Anaerolineales bacterium]|nr:ABC transporter permease subunit [Anaerolineales bacterium]
MASTALTFRPPRRQISWAWLGLLPFLVFAFAFLIAPAFSLLLGAFRDNQGAVTAKNFVDLTGPFIRNAYWLSIRISAVTALMGGVFGFLLAYALVLSGVPVWVRTGLVTFCGVASNFAGVPLAFAFVAILGRTGVVTQFFHHSLQFQIYQHGFNLYSFAGLSVTYLYFQLPLMVLIMAPALDGMKREWREASENLGASSLQYWQHVGLPILLPTILGTMILLFGNAFGAYATAYALTGGSLPLVTIQIGAQMRGDVLHNPGLGYAMALGMVVIMAVSIGLYTRLQRLSERWLR